jgi:hypothetical protein
MITKLIIMFALILSMVGLVISLNDNFNIGIVINGTCVLIGSISIGTNLTKHHDKS